MDPEQSLRSATAMVLVVTLIIGGYHRIQAARSGERISRKGEGPILFFAIRLMGLFMLVAIFSYLYPVPWMAWAIVPLPTPLRWIGVPVAIVTVVFFAWTLHTLGKNLTDTVAIRKAHTLVTTGPYRWVRHPFYVSMLGLVIAASLLTASWLLLVVGIGAFILLAIRVRIEEQHLLARFGSDYATYRQNTGAFFPRINSRHR